MGDRREYKRSVSVRANSVHELTVKFELLLHTLQRTSSLCGAFFMYTPIHIYIIISLSTRTEDIPCLEHEYRRNK